MPDAIKRYYKRYYYPKISDNNMNCPMDYCIVNHRTVLNLFNCLAMNDKNGWPSGYNHLQYQAYKYAGKNFNVIEKGNTVGLITQYGEAKDIVEEMVSNPYDLAFVKQCLKKLQRYTVNVYQTDMRLKEVENRQGITRFNEDILILDEGFYTDEEGLSTELSLEIF